MRAFSILLNIIELFLTSPSLEDVTAEILEKIGIFLNADRSYWFKVFSLKEEIYSSLVAEWTREGISPQINNPKLQFFPHESQGLFKDISRNKYFMGKVSDIKNPILREELKAQDIKAILVVPVYIENEYLGFIGLDRVRGDDLWSEDEIEFLRISAYLFGVFLSRYKTKRELDNVTLHLDTLLNSFPDIIIIKDKERRWLFANNFTLEFFGLNSIDYKGRTNEELVRYLKDEAFKEGFKRGSESDTELLKTKKPIQYISRYTFSDGREFFFEARKVPVYDTKKELRGILSIARDVTEEVKIKKQIEKDEKLKSLGRMAGNIAHDLNNILTAIMGSASILEKKAPDELKKYVDSILRASEEAKNLANQMLSYAGSRMLEEEVINLGEEVLRVGEFLRTSISKDIIFTIDVPEDKIYIKGNRGQIQQIVTNLVINANDVISKKGAKITLKVSKEEIYPPLSSDFIVPSDFKGGEYAVIEVTDEGPGIPESIKSHLFEPFYSTKGMGRGLGLFSVFGIVKGYDGAIFLKTEEGVGTTFRIYLPLTSPQEEKVTKNEKERLDEKRSKILIVDDEPYIRDVLGEMLSLLGYESFSAESGKVALEILHNHPDIKLAIIDYSMPEMNGLELLKKIREKDPGIKVVFSSGYTKEDIRDVATGDLITFLQKPYSIENLKKAINKLFPSK